MPADPYASLYKYRLAVTSVYDGDTVTGDIDLGHGLTMENRKIRLWAINTPEVRGKQRPEGLIVRDYLREWIDGEKIIIRTELDRVGKFGRTLGILFAPPKHGTRGTRWVCINQHLVERGMADMAMYGDKFKGWPKL